jgi:hypothetical protein
VFKYKIICLQGAPLVTWDKLHTKKELIDKFYDFARLEWETEPRRKWITLDVISEFWDVKLERVWFWEWLFRKESLL